MKKFLFFVIIFSSFNLFASPTNYISYIGGGGEPTGAKITQFDLGISNFSNFTKDEGMNYDVTVNFNGGHVDTEIMLKDKFKNKY